MGSNEKTADTTCIQCEHFYVITAQPGYSDVTPGSDFDICCNKWIWNFRPYADYPEKGSWFDCVHSALKCDKFERKEDVKKQRTV